MVSFGKNCVPFSEWELASFGAFSVTPGLDESQLVFLTLLTACRLPPGQIIPLSSIIDDVHQIVLPFSDSRKAAIRIINLIPRLRDIGADRVKITFEWLISAYEQRFLDGRKDPGDSFPGTNVMSVNLGGNARCRVEADALQRDSTQQ